jgi:hypothetical protein
MASTVSINPYSTRELTKAVEVIKSPEPFFQKMFFKNKRNHTTENINYEVYKNSEGIAKFVQGGEVHEIKKGDRYVKAITIPKTAEKKTFDAETMAQYKAFENTLGSPADSARAQNRFTTQELRDLKDRAIRLRELMCTKAMSVGSWSITQDNGAFSFQYPGIVTDTLANGGHVIATDATLGTVGSSGFSWFTVLEKLITAVVERYGIAPNVAIFGTEAARAFTSDEAVKKELDTLNNRVGFLDLNKRPESSTANYFGKMLGMNLARYSQKYTDKDGTVQNMYDPKKITLAVEDPIDNAMHFGPVYKFDQGGVARPFVKEFFVESKMDDDKENLIWKMLQRSIPGIHNPDYFITYKAISG